MQLQQLTRRDFMQTTAFTVLSLSVVKMAGRAMGAQGERVTEVPVIWMATGACSGCSVSLLNSDSPTIQELLLGEVLPGQHVSLGFHTTLMAASGEASMAAVDLIARDHPGGYVLVVDGATASRDDGLYCMIGEDADERPITGYEHVRDLGRDAMAVLAVGACAAFGGIPAAPPNPTGCLSVTELFEREQITTPVVNIPGCPPHPDWIVGSIATVLLGGLGALELDEHRRPKAFFGMCVHDNCPYRGHYDRGEFAEKFGDHGCLLKLGCKGPMTFADCPIRRFNNGVNWCIEAGHPCVACTEPDFPFAKSMFDPIEPSQLTPPAVFPAALTTTAEGGSGAATVGIVGAAVGAVAVGAAVGAAKLAQKAAPAGSEVTSDEKEGGR